MNKKAGLMINISIIIFVFITGVIIGILFFGDGKIEEKEMVECEATGEEDTMRGMV